MKKYYQPELVAQHVPKEPIPQEVRAQLLRPGELLSIYERFPVAFLPIGTLEWHGRQNPIGCDAIKAEQLCIETARRIGGAVMPPLYFSADGFRDVGRGYGIGMDAVAGFQLPGSFYEVDLELLRRWTLNACANYLSRGFKLVVMVSGHNPPLQQNLFDEVCYIMKDPEGREPVVFTMEYAVIEPGNPRRHSDHGAGYETSMMLHLAPERVNMKANLNQEIESLAIGGQEEYDQATAQEGAACLQLQIEGLCRFAREKFEALSRTYS